MVSLVSDMWKQTIIHRWYGSAIHTFKRKKIIKQWIKEGAELPLPPAYKHQLILDLAKEYQIKTLIETGTYKGGTVSACLHHFETILSIELSKELQDKNQDKFAKYPNVFLWQGDSALVLPEVLKTIKGKVIFWLDGHYSGGITEKGNKTSPILEELQAMKFSNAKGIILIDDFRLFGKEIGYPTQNELNKTIDSLFNNPTKTLYYDILVVFLG